jgi:hypothetical protein
MNDFFCFSYPVTVKEVSVPCPMLNALSFIDMKSCKKLLIGSGGGADSLGFFSV